MCVRVVLVYFILYFRVDIPVFACVCLSFLLMKLRLLRNGCLLFFLLLLLMLSHFLWAPDKPAEQGENGALYWDACQDSPWIYGQQTAFITQPREAEEKKKGLGGRGGRKSGEKNREILHLHVDPLRLISAISGAQLQCYDIINSLDAFIRQPNITGDYYIRC